MSYWVWELILAGIILTLVLSPVALLVVSGWLAWKGDSTGWQALGWIGVAVSIGLGILVVRQRTR